MRLFENIETHFEQYFEKSLVYLWTFWTDIFLFLLAIGYGLCALLQHWNMLAGEPRFRWVLAMLFAILPMLFALRVHRLMRRLLLKMQSVDKKLLAGISSSFMMMTVSAYVALFLFFSLLLKLWR